MAGLEKKEGRSARSASWLEKKESPSSPGGSRLGSEGKPARGSEASRDGDPQWGGSDESSILTDTEFCLLAASWLRVAEETAASSPGPASRGPPLTHCNFEPLENV